MLLAFGFYNLRPDVDLGAFRDGEAQTSEAYQAGCRTFGWESLGTYACEARPVGSWSFDHVHPYVIDASDPSEALRMAEESAGPPGFAEVVAIGRSFLTSQEDTTVVWFRPENGQPYEPLPLADRLLIVELGLSGRSFSHRAHPGWPVVSRSTALPPPRTPRSVYSTPMSCPIRPSTTGGFSPPSCELPKPCRR